MTEQLQPSPPDNANVFQEFGLRVRTIVTQPTDFFANLSLDGGMQDPLRFYGAIVVINAAAALMFSLKRPETFLYSCLAHITGFGVVTLMLHFVSQKFGGEGSIRNTARAFAYASAPMVIGWMPLIGFFCSLYSLYLMKLGIERVQNLPANRATTVVLLVVGTLLVIGVLVVLGSAALFVKKISTPSM